MKKIYIDPIQYTTKPVDKNRLEKELRVYDLLDSLEIPYTRIDHDATNTIEDCTEVEKMFNINICKNLFLCDSSKQNFYLLMMPGEKKFVTKDLKVQLNSSRLSFADESYMEEFLNITPGSVSVLGLMNDINNMVQLVIDEDILKEDYIGCHPCVNTSSLKIKQTDLIHIFLPAIKHKEIIVRL